MHALELGLLILFIFNHAHAQAPTLKLPWGVYEGQPFENDANVGK